MEIKFSRRVFNSNALSTPDVMCNSRESHFEELRSIQYTIVTDRTQFLPNQSKPSPEEIFGLGFYREDYLFWKPFFIFISIITDVRHAAAGQKVKSGEY